MFGSQEYATSSEALNSELLIWQFWQRNGSPALPHHTHTSFHFVPDLEPAIDQAGLELLLWPQCWV